MEGKPNSSVNGIKSWAEDDRPREKMQAKGAEALTHAELLAILIGSGTVKKTAVELGREILHSANNSLDQLGKLSIAELKKFSGIGDAKAITIAAALELGRRRKAEEPRKRLRIGSSRDAYLHLQGKMEDSAVEIFCIMLLNRANEVLAIETISIGGLHATIVDPKVVFRYALERRASAMILCHNHPSGNTTPSEADISLTKKLQAGGKLLDISVLDHLIIAGQEYTSLADRGLM